MSHDREPFQSVENKIQQNQDGYQPYVNVPTAPSSKAPSSKADA